MRSASPGKPDTGLVVKSYLVVLAESQFLIEGRSLEDYCSTMSSTGAPNATIAIWERAIQPSKRTLDEGAARALLRFRLGKRDLDRADALAAKAAKGKLSPAEAAELESYRSVSTALEFLKSKARRSLAQAG